MKYILSVAFFVSFFAIVMAPFVCGQSAVGGLVVDRSGIPLDGAAVILEQEGTGLARYGVQTTSDGKFHFTRVGAGRYRLVVSYLGYRSWKSVISIAEAAPKMPAAPSAVDVADLRIVLGEEPIPYPEVVVSFQRADNRIQPVTLSNISAEEVKRAPAMKDLPVFLARQPSITYYSENGNGMGYSSLRMRGFGQRRLAIAINGIPQNDPEEFNVFWVNLFDIQGAVEDIQIQRGAGSSLYGPAAIGGAINIRAMPYRPDRYASFETGRGTFNTQRYTAELNSGLLGGNVILFGRLSRLLSDGYRNSSWTKFWRFFAGVTLYGEKSTLTVQAYGGPQKDGLAFSGIPKAANKKTIEDEFGTRINRRYNFSSFDGDNENFRQSHAEVHHDLSLSETLRLSQSLFWIQGRGYFDFGGTFRSADYLRLPDGIVPREERGLPLFLSKPDATVLFRAFLDQWQIGWIPRLIHTTETLTATVGIELRLHRSLRWGRIQQGSSIPEEVIGTANDIRVYSFRSEKSIASVFGSAVYRIHPRWVVQGDIQATYRNYRFYDEVFFGNHFNKPYAFVNPRVGVTFNPEGRYSVYASAAYAQREPRMKSLYDGEEAGAGFQPAFDTAPDGSLDADRPFVGSENLIDLELGGSWTSSRARLSGNIFYMDFNNEIVPSGELDQFGVPRTGNADRSVHAGLEIEASVALRPGLRIRGNGTVSRNRFRKFTEFVTLPDNSVTGLSRKDNPIAGFPDQSGNLGLVYGWHGLNAGVNVAYVGKAYADNSRGVHPDGTRSNELIIDAYTMWDASLGYEFSGVSTLDGLKVTLSVNNLFDQKVLSFGNVGVGGPQYFPAATRHIFAGLRYTIR